MESGPVFAILTAIFFAITQVLVRRVTYQSEESFTPLAISMLVGTPIFLLLVTFFGEWQELASFSWQQYVLLGTAGLIHLIVARFLFFNSTRIIGANPTATITRTSVIFSIILGVVFLDESVTIQQIFGALLIMFGAILTTTEISRKTFKISTAGLFMGLGTALCSAGSATLIRPVMLETDAVYAATLIMYLSAFIVIVFIMVFSNSQRQHVIRQSRPSFIFLTLAAVSLVAGHTFRFSALEYSPVSIVQPLISTLVIFVLLFSWITNRKIDVFNWRIATGIIMVLAGVYLIYR